MSDNNFDPSIDWLADAKLTADQRRAWNTLREELASAQAKNLELADKLQQAEQSIHGPTILNRPDFNREVARMLAFDERYGGVSSVLYFDFDQLAEIAGRSGNAAINTTIREIGEVLIRNVRGSDIVGRLAPDEFGVLLMRCDNPSAWRKAEAMAAKLQECIYKGDMGIRVSYGAYTFRDHEDLAIGLKEAAQSMTLVVK
ncbi:MAG: diguanylate cyclase [Alphaproteobacteria bacterium]